MKVKPRHNHWLPKMLRVNAITIAPYVLFSTKKELTKATTAAHELIHLEQIEEDGWLTFHAKYLLQFSWKLLTTFSYRKAMKETPYEKDAYKWQDSLTHSRAAKKFGMWG